MQLFQHCLLAVFVSFCVGAALERAKTASTTKSGRSSVDAREPVRSRVDGYFLKKKPILLSSDQSLVGKEPVTGSNQQRQSGTRSRRIRPSTTQSSSSSLPDSCSPQRYRLQLTHGNCSQFVHTKMCHGKCSGYTTPNKSTFSTPQEARRGVDATCTCCKPVRISTRRHVITCDVVPEGELKSKIFYIPSTEGCSCRPCSLV